MKNNTRLPDPVIVVPGITASYLKDEYTIDHEVIWTAIKKNYQRIALHPDDLRYEVIEPSMVKHGQIFSIAYKQLIEELRYNLKDKEEEDVPVYPFGYDWRMPLESTAKALDLYIEEVIERTKLLKHYDKSGYGKDPKVNLIGHSMGGLVISGYLHEMELKKKNTKKENKEKEPKDRINKVVTLATPYQGSFEPPLKIATGHANLGEDSKPNSRERETARLTPALYYLLPGIENSIETDPGIPDSLFNPDAWQETVVDSLSEFIRLKGLPTDDTKAQAKEVFSGLLADAGKFRKNINKIRLEESGLDKKKWMAVVGVDAKTRTGMKITNEDGFINFVLSSSDRKNEWDSDDDIEKTLTGDGTVPFLGAIPGFLKRENLVCITPADYGYWEGVDKTLSKLAGFHGILPNMNMLHRLIVRFFKDQEDKRNNTWGRRAPGVENWEPPIDDLHEKGKKQ